MLPAKSNISIVFLGTQMEVAGAQRMLLSQSRWFQRAGYPVQAVFLYDKQGLIRDWQANYEFKISSLNAKKVNSDPISNLFRLLRGLWRLFLILRGVQVIVTYTPHSNILGLPVAWLSGVPVRIGTHHGYIEGSSKILAWLHGMLTNSRICSMMVAVSAQVREYEIVQEGADTDRITVIENGIESVEVRKSVDRLESRRLLDIADDELAILTVGRMTVQKGHTYLLEAIALLSPKLGRARFLFAGDGPLRLELETKAKELGISPKVAFLGVRQDIYDLLYLADIFIQPSLWEGLSLALLEALMAGLPVIATRVEGVVDVIEEGKSGLLTAPKDPQGLVDCLERLIANADLRRQLAAAGKERAKKNYSIDTMCKSYEALMVKLLPNVP